MRNQVITGTECGVHTITRVKAIKTLVIFYQMQLGGQDSNANASTDGYTWRNAKFRLSAEDLQRWIGPCPCFSNARVRFLKILHISIYLRYSSVPLVCSHEIIQSYRSSDISSWKLTLQTPDDCICSQHICFTKRGLDLEERFSQAQSQYNFAGLISFTWMEATFLWL